MAEVGTFINKSMPVVDKRQIIIDKLVSVVSGQKIDTIRKCKQYSHLYEINIRHWQLMKYG